MNDYDGTQMNIKTFVPLMSLQQPGTKATPRRWLYDVPLETPVTHELTANWTKKKEYCAT